MPDHCAKQTLGLEQAPTPPNDRRPSAREPVGDTEFVEQRLGFEISNPDRRHPAAPNGPTVDDLDDRIGAHNTLVYDRVDAAFLGDDADVAEAREIEHLGKTGKHLVAEERRASVRATPGKIVGRGPGEVGVQIAREACKLAVHACLIEGVDHGFIWFDFGLHCHPRLIVLRHPLGALDRPQSRSSFEPTRDAVMKNLAAVAITRCVQGAGASPQGGRAQTAVRVAPQHSVKEVARCAVFGQ